VDEPRDDLEASLGEIDRKLRDLQAELHVVGTPAAAPVARPEPAPAAASERPPAAPPQPSDHRLEELAGRVEGLRRLSAELEDATRALRDQLAS
jgi:hypothetical protein